MALLHLKLPDPIKAAEYMRKENECREALGDNAFGEDPNVSIILALGGIGSDAWLDEEVKGFAKSNPQEHGIVERVVRNYWPTFSRLNPVDQQRWIAGAWLLARGAPHDPGLAVSCFTIILEGSLRARVFVRFRDYACGNRALQTGCPDPPFDLFLKGKKHPTLGEMFTILNMARRAEPPWILNFAEWLKRDEPVLLDCLITLRTKLVDFRNAVCHSSTRIINTHEAEEVCQDCRSVIDALYSHN